MLQPNRHKDAKSYRYGFNGMEMDDEVKGEGNSINYKARFYDTRLNRFFTVDPLTSKFPMLSPYQFANNTPIWAVDLDGLEARVYTDLSLVPHTFISVVDEKDILNVYTQGQYGQEGSGIGALYNSGSALVHLKGSDAQDYIDSEFAHYSMSVYEISDKVVDKQKVIEYYAKEMETYNVAATKEGSHAPTFANEKNGSKAVKYKPYWLTPTSCKNSNCSSTALDGLEAGGFELKGQLGKPLAIPWNIDEALHYNEVRRKDSNYKNVTKEVKEQTTKNNKEKDEKAG